MRTPISRVRCATVYATTPYTPTAASATAAPAKSASSSSVNRRCASEPASASSIQRRRVTGKSGSASHTALLMEAASARGSDAPERTTSIAQRLKARFSCSNGT